MKFTKMHGAGNDYIYVNGFTENTDIITPEIIKKLSDRHTGIGSDGVVFILPSENCDFKMRMFNADGSEAEMCGNASRCVGKFVYEKGLTKKEKISLETKAGVKILEFTIENQKVKKIRVDMGEPILTTELIPAISINEQIINETIDIEGKEENITCVSMGNPHTVIFKQHVGEMNIEEIGKKIEIHKMFPRKTNVEFVEVINKELLNMRVWERGAGETLACGTGACATLVAASVNGLSKRKATVQLLGGNLEIEWSEENNHVYMTGDATFVFEGEIQL